MVGIQGDEDDKVKKKTDNIQTKFRVKSWLCLWLKR